MPTAEFWWNFRFHPQILLYLDLHEVSFKASILPQERMPVSFVVVVVVVWNQAHSSILPGIANFDLCLNLSHLNLICAFDGTNS